jgi:ferredoxin
MDSYEKFMDRLALVPIPSPRTKSGVEIEILKRLMTPEEAEIACLLTPVPESAATVAQRENMDAHALGKVLDRLSGNGVIFKVYTEEPLYALVPMVPGIFEFQVKRITPEDARLWERYYNEKHGEVVLGAKTSFLRVVPVKESVPTEMRVYTYEEVDAVIDEAKAITLADCVCRSSKKLVGEGCDAPVRDMCIILDAWAEYYAENNFGRRATKEEAKQTVERARAAGLVCSTINVQHGASAICACCGCCCFVLRGMTQLNLPASIAKSSFIAEISPEACTGCGECVDACHVDALKLEGEVAELVVDRCIGCGACEAACQFDAIFLKRKDESCAPPADMNELMQKIAVEHSC